MLYYKKKFNVRELYCNVNCLTQNNPQQVTRVLGKNRNLPDNATGMASF